ncbi:site-specific integrase, partial [Kitasatospora sp. NPDC087861]
RRTEGLDNLVVSLTAKGLTSGEIVAHLAEVYAGRPGGAQAVFHHEWKKEEAKEKPKRTVEAYRQFEQGQLPVGPGADALLAAFRAVEDELTDHEPGPAKVVTDRQIELLLKKKASVLHLSAANYCWFEDPAKALCLKLAGAKSTAAPLAGLCDSSRCPQATHHLVHRSVWHAAANNGAVLLASPRIPAGEKERMRAEHERSMRVLQEIDKAAGKAG